MGGWGDGSPIQALKTAFTPPLVRKMIEKEGMTLITKLDTKVISLVDTLISWFLPLECPENVPHSVRLLSSCEYPWIHINPRVEISRTRSSSSPRVKDERTGGRWYIENHVRARKQPVQSLVSRDIFRKSFHKAYLTKKPLVMLCVTLTLRGQF